MIFIMPKLNSTLKDSFIPFPSDSNLPLNKEQLDALFPHPEAWVDIIALTLEKRGINPKDVILPPEIER